MIYKKSQEVDNYIASFPKEVQILLTQIREIIIENAPQSKEVISYNVPGYKYKGMLVYFAGFKNHISLFPTNSGMIRFKEELKGYKTLKGTIHFPLNKPLPLELIKKIVEYRVKENSMKK